MTVCRKGFRWIPADKCHQPATSAGGRMVGARPLQVTKVEKGGRGREALGNGYLSVRSILS